MDIQKVYVRQDGTTVIRCHNCGTIKTVESAKLKKRGNPLKLRCSCRAVFKFFLNLEVLAAKKSLPDGYYAKPSKMNEWVKMRLNSISMNGIGFTTLNGNGLTINDRLMVKIFLGGGEKSQIEKTAVVM